MFLVSFCCFCLFASYPPQFGKKSDVKYRILLSWPYLYEPIKITAIYKVMNIHSHSLWQPTYI